jgi:short-subunit dehydrogenase
MKFPYNVVAITGASSGIGHELALQLASQGCKLGLMARRLGALEELAQRVRELGGEALAVACDVGDYAQVESAVAKVRDAFGPIDCMIANAGTGHVVKRLQFDPQATEQTIRTNFLGMTNAFYAALPDMLQRKRGHLVGVASLAGYQGMPEDAGYAASKAAMRVHCESMRLELRGTGVCVTTICPGFIRTPLTDLNDFDMPVLLEVDYATRRVINAIARKCRVYNFPRRMWWAVKLGLSTPRWLFDPFLASQAAKANGGRKQMLSTGDAPPESTGTMRRNP